MILPYLARVRITIAAAQVLGDRRSAAANVVVVIVIFERSQRGRTKLGAIETIKAEGRGISALLPQIRGSERGWGGKGVNMLLKDRYDERAVRGSFE